MRTREEVNVQFSGLVIAVVNLSDVKIKGQSVKCQMDCFSLSMCVCSLEIELRLQVFN